MRIIVRNILQRLPWTRYHKSCKCALNEQFSLIKKALIWTIHSSVEVIIMTYEISHNFYSKIKPTALFRKESAGFLGLMEKQS